MKVKVKNLTVNYKNNITKPSYIGDYLDIDGTKVYRYNINKVEKKVQTDENGEFKYTYLIHIIKDNEIYVYIASESKATEFENFLGKRFKFKKTDDISNFGKESNKRTIGPAGCLFGGILFIFIIMIVSLAIIGPSSGSSSSRENKAREMEERKEAKCRAKSDDYNKCSYSAWEGRCVCKRR